MSSKMNRKAVSSRWKSAFLLFIIPGCIGAIAAVLLANRTKAVNDEGEPDIVYEEKQPVVTPPRNSTPGQRRLANAAGSPDAVAKHFLNALAGGDEAAMRSLRLTKQEFCDYVWPELPASKVPNLDCDFAWRQATLNSEAGLYESLPVHKGKKYQLVSVRFEKGTETYQTYKVHRDARLRIRDEEGVEREIKLFGSMLELGGKFKLFSFAVD